MIRIPEQGLLITTTCDAPRSHASKKATIIIKIHPTHVPGETLEHSSVAGIVPLNTLRGFRHGSRLAMQTAISSAIQRRGFEGAESWTPGYIQVA